MQTKLQTIKRFLQPIKKSPLVHIRAFVIFTNWGTYSVINIFFLQEIIKTIESKSIDKFYYVIFFYILYLLFFYTFEFLMRKYGWTEVMNQIINDIQGKYIKKYVKLDNNQVEKYGTGKTISIIGKGFDTWGSLITNTLENGAYICVNIVFTIYMLSVFNIYYGFIFLIIVFIMLFIANYFNTIAIKYRNKRNDSKNLYTKQLVKILMSKNEIFQANKVDKEIDILKFYSDENIYYNKKMGFLIFGLFRFPNLLVLLSLLFLFYYLGEKVFLGELNISTFVGITGSIIIVNKSVEVIIRFYKDITKDFVIIQNLWDFFDNTPEISGYEIGKAFEYKSGDFCIKNLSYGYNESKKVFDDFSLDIEGGKILAIVGNSGGGKTTLIKLLSGYIRANSGEIIIDGQKLSDISLKSYYQNIGYLTQEPSVFDGTVRENLMYGIENVEIIHELSLQENLEKIILDSKCEFIYELPNGINTEIGERGIKLSGGQKQRLAIAKIMLKNPKIIFLDEPTSALDSFSEEQITKALHKLFEGKTVIIVAHRLQTVKHADKIIVIENGKVVEEGNHTSLIKQNGIYKKMLDLQSGF
ncbi:MAG: ABC transporter ATP-binding protein [Candidatus Gracilibacteria bacterium]|nr:ABC transporter ATP-binding protein [Candidatus Gracilibacteria bacterium]